MIVCRELEILGIRNEFDEVLGVAATDVDITRGLNNQSRHADAGKDVADVDVESDSLPQHRTPGEWPKLVPTRASQS